MTSFIVDECDQCHQEGKRDEPTELCWREVRLMGSDVSLPVNRTKKHFCSWACMADYASGQQERGQVS